MPRADPLYPDPTAPRTGLTADEIAAMGQTVGAMTFLVLVLFAVMVAAAIVIVILVTDG